MEWGKKRRKKPAFLANSKEDANFVAVLILELSRKIWKEALFNLCKRQRAGARSWAIILKIPRNAAVQERNFLNLNLTKLLSWYVHVSWIIMWVKSKLPALSWEQSEIKRRRQQKAKRQVERLCFWHSAPRSQCYASSWSTTMQQELQAHHKVDKFGRWDEGIIWSNSLLFAEVAWVLGAAMKIQW